MIHFDRVSKVYPDNSVSLDSVSLTIPSGEFLSIVGHSGAGKTTMLKLILAEDRPSEGSVYFDDLDVHSIRSSRIPEYRRRIGVVFQDFRLLPTKTAFENIAFAMEAAGKADHEIEADVPYVMDLVNMGDKLGRFPHQLSGGERQRLAIARAIINQPEVIIADEPTGNLDPEATYDVVQILKKINDLGTTVILTTHNKGVIDSLKKRVVTMRDGKLVEDSAEGQSNLYKAPRPHHAHSK